MREPSPPPKRRQPSIGWPDLAPDILNLIALKLGAWDLTSFRGVCSSWRAASTPTNPPLAPSLLLPYEITRTLRSFFDLADRQVHTLNIPESRHKWLYGTPYGFLVLLGKEEKDYGWMFTVSILNPITRDQISLPPLPKEIKRLPEQVPGGSLLNFPTKPILSANPASCKHVVVGLLMFNILVVCKLGEETWSMIDLEVSGYSHRVMADIAYFDGCFYAVNVVKGIVVVNLDSMKKRYSAPLSTRWDYHTLHLVVSGGDLLLFERSNGYGTEVFKMDRSSRKLKWVKVGEGLGDRAFFLSKKHSSMCLSSPDFLGGGEDLICFASDESSSNETVTSIRISEIVAGSGNKHMPHYWQSPTKARTYNRNELIGLNWILPSALPTKFTFGSGSRVMDKVPRIAAGEQELITSDDTGKRRGRVNWADLPYDVLGLILKKLISIWNYVRFRGVCKSWRSVASIGDCPRPMPSLLLQYDLGVPARSFFDFAERRVHIINIPEAMGKWLYGTAYGWLVMLGKEWKEGWMFRVSLLNPITRAQILFPSLPREITKVPEEQYNKDKTYSTKPILTADPASSQEVFIALLIFSRLAFFKLGGEAWTIVELSVPRARRRIMAEFTYFDGAFYVVDICKGVTILRTSSLKKKYFAPPSTRPIPATNSLHLVESCGDLLLLERSVIAGQPLVSQPVIEILKLDMSSRKLKRVRAEEKVGCRALFVSQHHSSVSLSFRESPGSGPDVLCFACDESKYDDRFGHVNGADISFSDVVAGFCIERKPYYWQGPRRDTTHWKNLIGITWIIPSLC